MERVTPQQLIDAFEKHCVRPTRAYYITRDDRAHRLGELPGVCAACAIGILVIDAVGFNEAMDVKDAAMWKASVHAALAALISLDPDYARGLDDGWTDIPPPDNSLDHDDLPYTQGYHDGMTAYHECCDRGIAR